MKIDFRVDDLAVQRTLARLGERARNLAPVFREIGEGVKAEAQIGFKSSTDPYGRAWHPLAKATIARRRKGSSKPLLDTGRLRNSIASRLLGAGGVEVGTNLKYAAIHQFGGKAGRGLTVSIPARPYIATPERGLPREYGEVIRDALARYFAKV